MHRRRWRCFLSALTSSIIVIAAVLGIPMPYIVTALGLRLYIPELLSDALFLGRFGGLVLFICPLFPLYEVSRKPTATTKEQYGPPEKQSVLKHLREIQERNKQKPPQIQKKKSFDRDSR